MPASTPLRIAAGKSLVRSRQGRALAHLAVAPALALVLLAGAGCAAGSSLSPVRAATVAPGELTGQAATPVLTLSIPGRDRLALDMASLESAGLVRASLYDPHEKRRLEVVGVEPAALRRAAMGAGAAREVRMVALDDYRLEFDAAELEAAGAILATRVDGRRIPIEEGGPTKLVFVDGSALGANANLWIWSLAEWSIR